MLLMPMWFTLSTCTVAVVWPPGEYSGFLSSQFPARAFLCNCIYDGSLRKLILSWLWRLENECKVSSSLLSSLLATAMGIGSRRHPALSCLTVGSEWADLRVLQSPCNRGTEHKLNRVPCFVMYPCET